MERWITILVVVGVILFFVVPIILMMFCSSSTEIYKKGACFTDDESRSSAECNGKHFKTFNEYMDHKNKNDL